ncbi:hypothetical protein Tco_1426208, partial [Tanacetum coccineum]
MPSFPSPEPTVSYFNNLDLLKDFEKEFSNIVYNDAPTEPTISPQHIDEFDLKDETSLSKYDEKEQKILYFNDLFPFNIIYPNDLKAVKENDDNEMDIIQSSGEEVAKAMGLTELMAEGLSGRMLMEHMDSHGHSIFTSRAWRRLFKIRGPFVRELILEFFSMFRFREVVLDLDTARALQFQLGGVRHRMSWREFILGMGLHTAEEIESVGVGAYWAESVRQIPDKGDLSAYWVGISSVRNFFGTAPSYTSIRDPMLRLCHKLIACRRYLRLFASGRKRGAMISRGQFVARLAEHFGLLTEERLQGLTVIVRDLPVIDMAELVPQEPPTAGPAKTMAQKLARLEEDVHGIRGALGEQRE